MIRGVIFDLGRTLIYFNGDWNEVFERSLKALKDYLIAKDYGIDEGEFINAFRKELEVSRMERYLDNVERPTADLFRDVMTRFGYNHLTEHDVEQAMETLYAVSEEHWIPISGSDRIVRNLKEEGFLTGLISNAGDERNVSRLMDKANLGGLFDPILVSASVGIRKPAMELFKKVLGEWELSPEEVVMVGDSLGEDIRGARDAGIHQIWMKSYVDPDTFTSSMESIIPEMVAENIEEVPQLIESIGSTKFG
ncbi:MAG: HAD-IA family hydrolase [Anaerolineales bacterium]|nr:HAD-IA family hydrolase [Anaerolineales bacterium]